jgi:hypothetical protein
MRLKFLPPYVKKVSASTDVGVGGGIFIKGLAVGTYAYVCAEARLELFDPQGRVAWTSYPVATGTIVAPLSDKAAVEAKLPERSAQVREQLLKEVLERDFPTFFAGSVIEPLVARDSRWDQVRLPLRQLGLGIDGYPEPPTDEPVFPK